jgi:hypothetical protein
MGKSALNADNGSCRPILLAFALPYAGVQAAAPERTHFPSSIMMLSASGINSLLMKLMKSRENPFSFIAFKHNYNPKGIFVKSMSVINANGSGDCIANSFKS